MKIIVPLAGPEYLLDGQIKGLIDIKGTPYLKFILSSRPWAALVNSHDYIFILYDSAIMRGFRDEYLEKWFPNSKVVFISDFAQGAALSVMAALPIAYDQNHINEWIIIDLADIYIEINHELPSFLASEQHVNAFAVTFKSDLPCYSYFSVDYSLRINNVSEKNVISSNASAGIYLFQGISLIATCLSESLKMPHVSTFNNLFYVSLLFKHLSNVNAIAHIIEVNSFKDFSL